MKYTFVFEHERLIKNAYRVKLKNDVKAIAWAFAKLDRAEYPPKHGRDITMYCDVYRDDPDYLPFREHIACVEADGTVSLGEEA